jgi:cytochrome c-type biogenesis protein CcmH/NrfG
MRSTGSKDDGQKAPEGYTKSTTTIGIAVICLAAGLIAGSLLGRAGVFAPAPAAASSSAAPAPTYTAATSTAAQGIIDALTEKARLNPGSAAAWTALGNACYDANQYQPAIDAYAKSVQLDPRNPDVLTDMGTMYRKAAQPQKAIESFNKALAINPAHQNALYNKGVVLMHDLGDTAGARSAWETLAKLHPGFTTTTGQTIETLLENLP